MELDEADWKKLRALHKVGLERFCTRVLEEAASLIQNGEGSAHERYLALFNLIRDRNEDVAAAFDDMRRSRAVERLAWMIALGIPTQEELQEFSPGMREAAEMLARPSRHRRR